MVDTVERTLSVELLLLNRKIRLGAVKNTRLNIVGLTAAERKELRSLYRKNLTAHQMNDIVPYNVDLAAVPLSHGKRVQHIEVFVVSVDEKQCELLLFEPVKPVFFGFAAVPDTAEIAANDDAAFLIVKVIRYETPEISVRITCYVYFYAGCSSLNRILFSRSSSNGTG